MELFLRSGGMGMMFWEDVRKALCVYVCVHAHVHPHLGK